jgi:pimeloyl-ACP methyl ester carboxylesterase
MLCRSLLVTGSVKTVAKIASLDKEHRGFGKIIRNLYNPKNQTMKTAALFLTVLLSAAVWAQKPVTGYAPVNGLKMYYEIHGKGEPVVLLHGSFMTITNNWQDMIAGLSRTRQVIAVEMQGHGRTADIKRDFTYENLADDIAAMLDYLKIEKADLIGYSMGGGVAMQVAIRHPEKVRKVVSISAVFRHDGWVKEALDMFPQLTPETFKASPIETEYKRLSPTPNEFPNFIKRVISMDLKPYDFGAEKLRATKAPMFFIHGDADGVRLDHIAEMFRLKGDEIFGDMRPRSASRLAILPNTTHVTLMQKIDVVAPMINDFLDAEPPTKVVAQLNVRFGSLSDRPRDGRFQGLKCYTSVCSEISSASSTSMPRYRTVLSSFVWPSSNCTARRFFVRR